ncbi:MAG: hypothetical protein ACT4OY_02890 [Alphaproteobacteria bacterium]
MDFLSQLSPDQRQVLKRLPYRIGLWISQSDREGGEEATVQELQSLCGIIHGFAHEVFSSSDIQAIMSETLSAQKEWTQWGSDITAVPEECRAAMEFVRAYGDRKDMSAIRNHLMEIGEAVAMAFCERRFSFPTRLARYPGYLLQNKGARRRRSFQDYLSISSAERKALKSMARALGTSYR